MNLLIQLLLKLAHQEVPYIYLENNTEVIGINKSGKKIKKKDKSENYGDFIVLYLIILKIFH